MSGLVGGPGAGRAEEAVYADIERALPHFEESCRQFLALTRPYEREADWRAIDSARDAVAGAADFTTIVPVLDGVVAATDRLIGQARDVTGIEVAGATLARNALALKGFIGELAALE